MFEDLMYGSTPGLRLLRAAGLSIAGAGTGTGCVFFGHKAVELIHTNHPLISLAAGALAIELGTLTHKIALTIKND